MTTSKPAKASKPVKAAPKKRPAKKQPAKKPTSAKAAKETPLHPRAAELMELHLAHELAGFEAGKLSEWIRTELDTVLEWLSAQALETLVSRENVLDIIRRNVVENETSGAGVELAGEAATHLYSSKQHRETLLKDIMSTAQFATFADKLLELREQRMRGIGLIIDLPIYRELLSGVLYKAMVRYLSDNSLMNARGVSSVLKMGRGMMNRTMPNLEGALEENVRKFISRNISFLLNESKAFFEESLSDEELKESAMDLWDVAEQKTLGEIQQGMNSLDLSEFVVLGYEYWLNFRTSEYFRESYTLIVNYIYARYGEQKVGVLLSDFDIDATRILNEVEPLLPALLDSLKGSGTLETILRRRLADFYGSTAASEFFASAD